MSEVYAQDDSVVTITHQDRYRWRLNCSCGELRDSARSESEATEKAMGHVLEHDIAYEADVCQWCDQHGACDPPNCPKKSPAEAGLIHTQEPNG